MESNKDFYYDIRGNGCNLLTKKWICLYLLVAIQNFEIRASKMIGSINRNVLTRVYNDRSL